MPSANEVVKSYSSFSVNEGLLAKVVAAVKQGEADARRYGQVRSFEIFYSGHRLNLVLGRIMLIPAKVADSIEDFPSALLYGAMVKEFSGETIADVFTYKLGDSEFDEYNKGDLAAIKKGLFTDEEGNLRTLVMFIPTWAAPRDYVTFKYTRNEERLLMLIRHMIYGVYFDPALSSAFNDLSTDVATERLDVTDITPKLNFPFLAENLLKQYPELEPGDKTAANRKPKLVLTAATLDAAQEEFLEPGEQAVLGQLFEKMKDFVDTGAKLPEEAAKQAARGAEQQTYQGWRRAIKKVCPTATFEGDKDICSAFDKEGKQDLGEWDGAVGAVYSKEAKALTGTAKKYPPAPSVTKKESAPVKEAVHSRATMVAKGVSFKTAGNFEWSSYSENGKVFWSIFKKGLGGPKLFATGEAQNVAEAQAQILKIVTHPDALPPQRMNEPLTTTSSRILLERSGSRLRMKGASLIAESPNGHSEALVLNGRRVKWQRPNRFAIAFRASVEKFIRLPRTANMLKAAEVPQTLEDIWGAITEDMGEAPSIALKSDSSAAPKSKETPDPKKDTEDDTDPAPSGKTRTPVKEGELKEKTASVPVQTGRQACIGTCATCKKSVWASEGSEVGPGVFLHAACQEKAKLAAFNLFIPGQVTKEFYPEILNETVDYPNDTYNPMISDVGPQADGAYVSTDPAGGIGIGQDGKPQVLEGAPLRQENDIRGYMFDQEFYQQYDSIDSTGMSTASILASVKKTASDAEFKTQFTDFLKKAMGEVAATFMAAFKVTQRPMMNRVPGVGEIQLQNIEQPTLQATNGYNVPNVASRVRYLVSKLNDGDLQEAINASYSQASVWNDSEDGGYVYEVFVRPESLDQDTLILTYSFVVGTKGL